MGFQQHGEAAKSLPAHEANVMQWILMSPKPILIYGNCWDSGAAAGLIWLTRLLISPQQHLFMVQIEATHHCVPCGCVQEEHLLYLFTGHLSLYDYVYVMSELLALAYVERIPLVITIGPSWLWSYG